MQAKLKNRENVGGYVVGVLAHSCTHSLVSVCVEPTINASSSIEFWFGFNTGFGSWFYYAVFEGVTLNIDPAAKVANNRLLLQLLSSLTDINIIGR